MKTRAYILMLALGCAAVMSVFAAQEGTNETTGQAESVVATVKVTPPNPNAAALKSEMDKVSYIIGTQVARSLKSQEIEVNADALMMGLKDALAEKPLAMSNDEMKTVYGGFQAQMRAKQAAKQAASRPQRLQKTSPPALHILKQTRPRKALRFCPAVFNIK